MHSHLISFGSFMDRAGCLNYKRPHLIKFPTLFFCYDLKSVFEFGHTDTSLAFRYNLREDQVHIGGRKASVNQLDVLAQLRESLAIHICMTCTAVVRKCARKAVVCAGGEHYPSPGIGAGNLVANKPIDKLGKLELAVAVCVNARKHCADFMISEVANAFNTACSSAQEINPSPSWSYRLKMSFTRCTLLSALGRAEAA
eukprot:CAMPEP_0172806208 /NCGR_PEP_ID=MMETSP1075-20121228/6199_1 /TAXON_ID=2916 /ORGANISM="Ceratium fusus, Strain PA161109" /LENGTH=198 /DNA_ID=CAMNT_0013644955 /DNA_START=546 /DNA_END=1139 /DNA_ORIENTATION=+